MSVELVAKESVDDARAGQVLDGINVELLPDRRVKPEDENTFYAVVVSDDGQLPGDVVDRQRVGRFEDAVESAEREVEERVPVQYRGHVRVQGLRIP